MLFPCLACLYLYIFARLVARHGYSPEPVHVYELNAYLDLMVWASCSGFGLGHLQHSLAPASPWSPYCVVTNYLQYCARLCLYADISAGEVDRWVVMMVMMMMLVIMMVTGSWRCTGAPPTRAG